MKVALNKTCYSGEKFRATRPLDYIYDPLFTFSGSKDYYKTAHESYQASSEFTVQPIFDSMFSDMVRYPRATLVLRPSHQVPHSIDTSYKGKVKAVAQERTVTAEVTGVDRYKYFRRPVTEMQLTGPPTGTASRTLLGLDNVTQLGVMAPPATAEKVQDRSSRLSVAKQVSAVQTDFRESEAQTLPWTPPFTSLGRVTPEVLRLDQLTWGNGLPPGQHEVEIVERLRKKEAWEAQLPPLDTEENIKKRHKIISDMEKSDWNFRAKEIQSVHEERMKKSEKLLEQHVLLNRTRLSYRMEFLEDEINKKKERKLQLLNHEKERALRKLCMKEKGYNPKQRRVKPVAEHLHHASQLYAPVKRLGTSFKNRHEVLADKSVTVHIDDLDALENAVEYRPVFDFNKASQPKRQTELCVRETRWTMENLAKLHRDLQMLHVKQQQKINPYTSPAVEKRKKPIKVRQVPSLPMVDDSKENLYQAAVLIQRVIHGRAVQTQMHESIARWKEVMEELRSAEKITKKQLSKIHDQRDRTIVDLRLHGVMKSLTGYNVDMTIGQTIDLLAEELLRFKNEGISHICALQAERARWSREVIEAGRRQKEMRRREEHNLMFSQLLEMYQYSINDFMDVIVTRAREHEAKVEAYDYAQEMARLAELLRLQQEEIDTEPVSADLLFALIAPEGLRELARTCVLILKQKYEEARQTLVDTNRADPRQTLPPVAPVQSEDDTTRAFSAPSSYSISSYSFPFSQVTECFTETATVSETDLNSLHEQQAVSNLPECPPVLRFGLVTPQTPEEKLLSRIMRDMCFVSGKLLHTAAKILNKALELSGVPRESFEEALRATMLVINGAREEIFCLILPKQDTKAETNLLPSQIAPEEVIGEARQIVNSILAKAKEKIAEIRKAQIMDKHGVPRIVVEADVHSQAKKLVGEVIEEAQRRVLQTIVEDFLSDLMKEANNRVSLITGDWKK